MSLLIDLNFHSNTEDRNIRDIIKKQEPALMFSKYMDHSILFIKHANKNESLKFGNVEYTFFKKKNGIFSIPIRTISYIRKHNPKIILIQGFIFPVQLIILRALLSKKVRIIVQHHGESPWSGLKLVLQRIAGKLIHACLFTSIENSVIWKTKGIIKETCPCFELLEASTHFKDLDQREALKKDFGMKGSFNFLWVGRLNSNKDPMTIVRAFSVYHKLNPEARLFMIYQDTTLLPVLKKEILDENLSEIISLVGEVSHNEIEKWFNAADFYISGSHKESCGYALIEAMACGCIPIVTTIPSFKKITSNGAFGILYKAGDQHDLLIKLKRISLLEQTRMRKDILEYFQSNLSYKSIANDLDAICNFLLKE